MRISPQNLYSSSGELESKFNNTIKQYDGYINKVMREVRTWQLLGLLSVVMVLCTVIGWFYVVTSKKDNFLVVEINELGRAKYLGNVGSGNYRSGFVIKDYMIISIINDFLEFSRNIYADGDLMNDNYRKASHWASSDVKIKLREALIEENPFQFIGQLKRLVSIESHIKITEGTWQYDWYDVYYDMKGHETEMIRYRGLFTIVQNDPETEEERTNNPLGIYIVDYNIQKISEVVR